MEERTARWRRTTGLLAAVALIAVACSGGDGGSAAPASDVGGGASAPATSGRLPPAMAAVRAPARSRWPV